MAQTFNVCIYDQRRIDKTTYFLLLAIKHATHKNKNTFCTKTLLYKNTFVQTLTLSQATIYNVANGRL